MASSSSSSRPPRPFPLLLPLRLPLAAAFDPGFCWFLCCLRPTCPLRGAWTRDGDVDDDEWLAWLALRVDGSKPPPAVLPGGGWPLLGDGCCDGPDAPEPTDGNDFDPTMRLPPDAMDLPLALRTAAVSRLSVSGTLRQTLWKSTRPTWMVAGGRKERGKAGYPVKYSNRRRPFRGLQAALTTAISKSDGCDVRGPSLAESQSLQIPPRRLRRAIRGLYRGGWMRSSGRWCIYGRDQLIRPSHVIGSTNHQPELPQPTAALWRP